jgi:hypothetical protein
VNFRLLMKDENCSQRFRERKYNVDCKWKGILGFFSFSLLNNWLVCEMPNFFLCALWRKNFPTWTFFAHKFITFFSECVKVVVMHTNKFITFSEKFSINGSKCFMRYGYWYWMLRKNKMRLENLNFNCKSFPIHFDFDDSHDCALVCEFTPARAINKIPILLLLWIH